MLVGLEEVRAVVLVLGLFDLWARYTHYGFGTFYRTRSALPQAKAQRVPILLL